MKNNGEVEAETSSVQAEAPDSTTTSTLRPLGKEDGATTTNTDEANAAPTTTATQSCASKQTEEKEETEVNELACPSTSSIATTQENVPADGKRLVVQKSKDHGYREYLTLRRQTKRAFFDAAGDDDRTNILNQFFDRFLFVEKDGCTPLSTTEARNKIIQDLYETKTFSPLPKSKPLVTGNNQAITSAKVAAAAVVAAAAGIDDDPSHEEYATTNEFVPKKKLSRWKAWDSDKIVVQYGKYARKNNEYIRFRAEWTDKYQAGSREQREKIIEDALKRFTFVREDDGHELQYDIAWKKVQKDLGRTLVLPSRYFHESEKQDQGNNHDEEETEDEQDEAPTQHTIKNKANFMETTTSSKKETEQNYETIATNSSGDNGTFKHSDPDHCTNTISNMEHQSSYNTQLGKDSEEQPAAQRIATPTPTPSFGHHVVEKSIVFLGRSAKKNEEYLKLRIEWKPTYHAASCKERSRIVEEILRRFVFQQENGTELAPEAARKKVTKDFFTELRSPDKLSPRRHDSYESLSKGREQQATSGKKTIVQLGESEPKSNLYWRLTAEWKPKYKVGKSEERQRIVDHILNRFTFMKDGVELSHGDASKKVVGDLNDQESLDEEQPVQSRRKSRHRSASSDSKSSEAENVNQTKKSKSTDPQSKDHSDEEREESEKPVVYGGASRGEGNMAYTARLKERKWDYINAETEEDAEKVVDSILEAFIFHNFTPEAARKKVSQGLQEIGERIATKDFRWKAKDNKEKKHGNHSRKLQPPSENRRSSKSRAKRRLSESSDGSSALIHKKPRRSSSRRIEDAPNSNVTNIFMSSVDSRRNVPVKVEQKLDLAPLCAPPPLPDLPRDGPVQYRFDVESRVVLVDFSKAEIIPERDMAMLNCLMQRDDLSVVSEGLLSKPFSLGEFLQNVELQFQGRTYHKFRRFDRVQQGEFYSYLEAEGYVSMKVSCYIKYLKLLYRGSDDNRNDFSFTYSYFDSAGQEKTELVNDFRTVVFYMTDVEMPNLLPKSYNGFFLESFKLREALPGGKWCMLNVLPLSARPFMGPNVYITPGGGYTQFHQDGHGTVDSGHLCLHGFNEVVMLRRIPEHHKINVFATIPMRKVPRTISEARHALYQLPHDDGYDKENKALWPTKNTINEWRKLNYCPSVFVLKPGQHLHINKGRLHAFRKLTFDELPSEDCHNELRLSIQRDHQRNEPAPLCVSVAWDWERFGLDSTSINEEVSSALMCAELCRLYEKKCLAIPEISILQIASHLVDKVDESFSCFGSVEPDKEQKGPSANEIAKGILPSLEKIAGKTDNSDKEMRQGQLPDTYYNPLAYHIDPFGNDYFCKLCNKELSNVYFHCNGCEELLQRDFNICSHCFADEKYKTNIHMHALDNRMASDVHHTGKFVHQRSTNDCCHRGNCRVCKQKGNSFCKTCSCTCHLQFTKHMRLFSQQEVEGIVKNCRKVAGVGQVDQDPRTSFVFDVETAPKRTEPTGTLFSSTSFDQKSSAFDKLQESPLLVKQKKPTCVDEIDVSSHSQKQSEMTNGGVEYIPEQVDTEQTVQNKSLLSP